MKYKISIKKLLVNIVISLIVISTVCIFFSKGSFDVFTKYFIISVLIFTAVLFILISIIFNIKKKEPPNNKNVSHNREKLRKLESQFYFEDNELIRNDMNQKNVK